MYNFVYYVIYNQQIQKGKSARFSRANGGLVVGLAVAVHICLILVFMRRVLFKLIGISSQSKDWNFAYIVTSVAFWCAFWWIKTEKRTQIIMDKLVTDKDPSRTGNIIKVFAIIVIPIIIIFALSPSAV